MSDGLVAALIGLGGVVLGSLGQWLISRSVVRAETERLHRQLSAEFRLQQFSEWQSKFSAVIAELLAVTDIEASSRFEKQKIVPLVLKAQLLLNPSVPSHAKVNGLINRLALAVNGCHEETSEREILSMHAELLDAAREAVYLPGRVVE
jgi:hypothetical protein